jgi:hypothetical protein
MNEQTLKEYIKSLVREILEEESTSGDVGAYSTPYAFSRKGQKTNAATQAAEDEGFTKVPAGMPSDSKVKDYKQLWGKSKKYKIYESIDKIVKEELLNEVTYNKFKSEVKLRSKNEQLHKAIKEVKRKLMEIDRIVEYTSMMKQELSEGEEGLKYWKTTESNVSRIAEMVNNLNTKIQNLQQ